MPLDRNSKDILKYHGVKLMALLQNMRVLNAEPLKMSAGGTAGAVAATACVDRFCFFNRPETYMNKYMGSGNIDNKGGVPYGYLPPYQFEMPIKEGGMSTFAGILGSGTISSISSINKGINLLSTITGYGTVPDIVTALSPFIAKLDSSQSGSGNISNPVLDIISVLLSNLSGSGSISNAVSVLQAKLDSELSGSGTIPDLTLDIMSVLLAYLSGSGSISSSNATINSMLESSIHSSGTISNSILDIISVLIANLSGQGSISSAQAILNSKLDAAINGSGTITLADLMILMVVVCEASIQGSGSVSSANLILPLNVSSTINGSGSTSTASLDSISAMVSNISNSGTITQAQIKTFSYFITNVIGSGTLAAIGKASCEMNCEMTSAGDLVTPQSCAQAVWSALAAAFNESGTMGNKVNSASAAGDPWTAELPGLYADGSAGAIIEKI